MPSFCRFKKNPVAQPDLNITGLVSVIGDEVGEVSRALYPREFSDGIVRDCFNVTFYRYGGEEVGIPSECFTVVEAESIEAAAELLPPWD